MPKYPRDLITYPKLILCEGRADEAFIRAFLDVRQLGNATIRNTSDADFTDEGRGSISLFGELLLAATMWKNFDAVTDILIICDSDDNPQANFDSICDQIAAINESTTPPNLFGVPAAFVTPAAGSPTIRIISIPWINQPGNLECLCAPAALAKSPHAPHVAAFGTATGVDQWARANSIGKFKMRALLSVTNEADPAIGIGKLWSEADKDKFVPLGDPSFDAVAESLAAFFL